MIFTNLRLFLVVFGIILSISISVAYVSSIPREYERFMSLHTLGSNMSIKDYYPNGASIELGDVIKWYIQVHNHMGSVEYISVRIKLLNATQEVANDNLHTPSPIEHIYEFKQALANNSTLTLPLQWKIGMAAKHANTYVIKQIIINDEIIDVDVRGIDGKNFRMVIELWIYNPHSKQFEFSWLNGNERRSVWNQIWFNVK